VVAVDFLLGRLLSEDVAVEGDLCSVVVDVDDDEQHRPRLVDHREARKAGRLPDADHRPGRVADDGLDADVLERHRRGVHRGAVPASDLQGGFDVVGGEERFQVLSARLSAISPMAPASGTPRRVNMKYPP